jgi:hypothetical protein
VEEGARARAQDELGGAAHHAAQGRDPQEVAQWRKDNGIPEKPEDYKINMPAGKQAPKEDDGFLKAFLKSAHDHNYTRPGRRRAQRVLRRGRPPAGDIGEDEKKLEMATEDKLRKEWGADYRTNKAMAEALLARAPAGFRDRFMNGYLVEKGDAHADQGVGRRLEVARADGARDQPGGDRGAGRGGDLGKTIEPSSPT